MASPRSALATGHCGLLIYCTLSLVLVQLLQSHQLASAQNQNQKQQLKPKQLNDQQKQQQQQQQQLLQGQGSTKVNNDAQVRPVIGDRQSQPTQPGADDEYLIGVGIADITGPSADINLVSVLGQLAGLASNLFSGSPPATSRSSKSPSSSSSSPSVSSAALSSKAIPRPPPSSRRHFRNACHLDTGRQISSVLASLGQHHGHIIESIRRESVGLRKASAQHLIRNQDSILPLRSNGFKSGGNNGRHRQSWRNMQSNGTAASKRPPSTGRARKAAAAPTQRQASVSLDGRPLMNLAYPSWRDLQNVKLQLKMGYAKPNQDAGGIHLRQFSRSVIVEDRLGSRVLYVNLDNGMISQLLRTRVLRRLAADFGEQTFNESNVMLSATHTHSCPGGFFQYMLYNIPSAGFISQTLEALVEGIARSVARAHHSMQPGRIYLARGELLDASVNRSPTSYANNPAQERGQYAHDTDKDMWLLRLVDRQGGPLAMLNWFAVHGTSMNNSNHLISSDNKGYAALLMEADFNPAQTAPGQGKFVAIFAQANEGDVSPNTRGPRCIDSGLPCDDATSTCGNPPRNEKCIASGPGKDMFESTKIIAYKQYYKARQLFLDQASQRPVRGPVRYVHQHIDMTKQQVPLYESVVELSKRHALMSQLKQQQLEAQSQMLQAARLRRRQDRQEQQQQQQQLPAAITQTIVPHVHQAAPQSPAPIPLNASYQTCLPGLGYSFAAGTTDGPGAFDFQQGDTASTRYWNMVRDFLRRPSEEQLKCHHPKPILLSTGEMDFPYMWHPKVVPTQILMIGQVAIVGLPGEFTTMSGRRVRAAVKKQLQENQAGQAADFTSYQQLDAAELDMDHEEPEEQDDVELEPTPARNSTGVLVDLVSEQTHQKRVKRPPPTNGQLQRAARVKRLQPQQPQQQQKQTRDRQVPEVEVILSGLSNIYTSYITTIEEYEMQRYEGASTLYGPHTLQAYINQFRYLASFLKPDQSGRVPINDSLQPPDLTKSLFTLKAGVIFDGAPHGKNFGELLVDVDTKRVYRCRELAAAVFVAANPRNDLKQEQSYLYVDKFDEQTREWAPLATDASWETKFIWERTNTLFGESKATIEWAIPDQCQTGVYRIRHYGAHKSLLQTVSQYAGKSSPFKVASESTLQPQQAGNSTRPSGGQLQHLDQVFQLAEQLEALQSSQQLETSSSGQRQASQPKSDNVDPMRGAKSERPSFGSLLAAPFKYLGSLARPWQW